MYKITSCNQSIGNYIVHVFFRKITRKTRIKETMWPIKTDLNKVNIHNELVGQLLPQHIIKYFNIIEFKKIFISLFQKNTKTNKSGLMGFQ